MVEVIITIVVPAKEQLVQGTGALLSRDRMEVTEPAHTRVWRMEFETEEDALMFLDTSDDPGGLNNVEVLQAAPERWKDTVQR